MRTLYLCVLALNLFCFRESAYSFGSRHSASNHHWLNEPCRIESSTGSSLVCAGYNSRYISVALVLHEISLGTLVVETDETK